MTQEQQILLRMARQNIAQCDRHLERGMVGLALQHLSQAQTNLEQFKRAGGVALPPRKTAPALDIETTTVINTNTHEHGN